MRHRSVAAVVLAAAAGAGMSLPSASAAEDAGGLGIRLTEAPVSAKLDPRARVYIVDSVRPGTTFTRGIEVSNNTGTAQTLDLYPAAADIGKGAWTVQAGRAQNELTTWIQVEPPTLQLADKAKAKVEVRVSVPSTATNGERYAAVLASTRPQAKPGQAVAVVNRIGIRLYLAVSNSSALPTEFTVESLAPGRTPTGEPFVSAQVKNTGGRALDLSGTLKLTKGPGGLSAGPFPAKLGTTLGPGQTEPVTVALDKSLPAGPWFARLDLESGLLKRAVTATITFPPSGQAAPVPALAVKDEKRSLWPFIVGGAVGLLVLLGLLLSLLKRRRRPRASRDDPADVLQSE